MSAGATRIYEQRGYLVRQWISTAILAGAILYGAWELVASFLWPQSANSALFGALFIGAGIYGAVRLSRDSANTVAALDLIEAENRLAVTLWRPWGNATVSAPTNQFSNWNLYISIAKRHQVVPQIRFDLAGRPGTFIIEIKPNADLSGLRKVAPEVVADYEERVAPPKPAEDAK